MTQRIDSQEGNKPLLKDSSFWIQFVLPILAAIAAGVGIGVIADDAGNNWEREMQERNTAITSPADVEQPSSVEMR